jgi:hypothetical protein
MTGSQGELGRYYRSKQMKGSSIEAEVLQEKQK